MPEQSHLAKFAEFVIGDDNSELGIARAERDYALHCLEREIAIAQSEQAKSAALVKALERIANETTQWDWETSDGPNALVKILLQMRVEAREALALVGQPPVPGASSQGGDK